jgi:predicted O-methyltransferase YrrM
MLKEIKEYARASWIPVILDDSLKYIEEEILKGRKLNKILEIGTAIGYSSICFSKFLTENGKIDTIEIDKQRIMIAKVNTDMMGVSDKINIIEGDALKVIKKLDDKYDFIFIDGPKSHYIEYLPICLNLLQKDGVIIADNILYKGMVTGNYTDHKQRTAVNRLRQFIDMVENDASLTHELVDVGDGLMIIQKAL